MDISRKDFLKGLAGAGMAPALADAMAPELAEAQASSGASPKQARIAEVEVFPFTMQSKEVFRISIGTLTAENVLVRVRTEDGVWGWGESSPFAAVTGDTQATNLAASKMLAG